MINEICVYTDLVQSVSHKLPSLDRSRFEHLNKAQTVSRAKQKEKKGSVRSRLKGYVLPLAFPPNNLFSISMLAHTHT